MQDENMYSAYNKWDLISNAFSYFLHARNTKMIRVKRMKHNRHIQRSSKLKLCGENICLKIFDACDLQHSFAALDLVFAWIYRFLRNILYSLSNVSLEYLQTTPTHSKQIYAKMWYLNISCNRLLSTYP